METIHFGFDWFLGRSHRRKVSSCQPDSNKFVLPRAKIPNDMIHNMNNIASCIVYYAIVPYCKRYQKAMNGHETSNRKICQPYNIVNNFVLPRVINPNDVMNNIASFLVYSSIVPYCKRYGCRGLCLAMDCSTLWELAAGSSIKCSRMACLRTEWMGNNMNMAIGK